MSDSLAHWRARRAALATELAELDAKIAAAGGVRYGLTKQQIRALDFIRQHIKRTSTAPSFDEIQCGVGVSSKSTVHRYVHALVERGHITLLPGRPRSIAICE